MLVREGDVEEVADDVLSNFLGRYPEKAGVAHAFVAQAEAAVRIL